MYESLSESPLYSSGTMKRVLQELKDLKFRLSKVEDEVATLHELVGERDRVLDRRDSLSLSPPRILDFAHSLEDDDLRWSHELPRNDYETDSKARSVAMMMHNHAWYGDVFLYEVMCQMRGYRPRDNHWFNSLFPFYTLSRFQSFIQSQKWFHHTCVLSIGYSDLFRFQSLNDKRMKWLLHQILNHMRDCGAETIKVLSIPPARQMMKNAEYLRLCQTNNRALQSVTDAHPGVYFINLDSFFLKNSDESFNYFEEGEISVEILDNLLMKRVDDRFSIYIDPETAQSLLDHVAAFDESSTELPYITRKLKGFDSTNDSPKGHELARYDDRSRGPVKRRREDSFSYESEFRLSPDFHSNRHSPPPPQRESPPRRYRRSSPPKHFDYKSSRRRDSRFNDNTSPPNNHPQSSALSLREENSSRHDRRPFARQSDSDDLSGNASVSFYTESSRSKRREEEPYEERIVSKSTTEVRLVRYGERKSPTPTPPPPWLKNTVSSLTATSSRPDRWTPK